MVLVVEDSEVEEELLVAEVATEAADSIDRHEMAAEVVDLEVRVEAQVVKATGDVRMRVATTTTLHGGQTATDVRQRNLAGWMTEETLTADAAAAAGVVTKAEMDLL